MFIELDEDEDDTRITIRENVGENKDDIVIYPKDEDENDISDSNNSND